MYMMWFNSDKSLDVLIFNMIYNMSVTNAEVFDILFFTLQMIIAGIWGQALLSWPPNFNVNILEIDIKILPFTEVEINLLT
jgi:hypothetical protein